MKIIIPNGTIKIAEAEFYANKSITSVIIPEGVTEIGDSAFEECDNLCEINIAE